jgi:GntR family transcriptional regulator
MVVDRTNPVPFYAQVEESIRESIEHGEWQVGQQIPGEMELCELYGVSRTVIRQALNELAYKGLIQKVKGKGTFVAASKISENLVQELTGFYQDMTDSGRNIETFVLEQKLVPANPKVAAALGIAQGVTVVKIDRLRYVEGEPMVLVVTYIPYAICPELISQDFSDKSLYAFLESRGLYIVSGNRTIEAVSANDYEANLLQIKPGAPLLLLNSISYIADGTPLEYYHALHRGDRSKFEVKLVRKLTSA